MDHDADLVDFLDALVVEKAALIGNSMGAHTAVRYATLHPDRITHLATMGASLGRAPPACSAPATVRARASR